jgi:hypothetical protein
MSEIKHTPLVADAERVRLQDGTLIATVWEQYPSKDRQPGESWLEMMDRTKGARELSEQQAIERARVFAAAPELLEALQRLLKGEDDEYLTPQGLRNLARAAIAKATGSQA